MDTFDYLIIAVGVILILIGLWLFIAGRTDSDKANQVEGFGIKLNVSNPSIILIVFGIGLLLVPRLLPNNSTESKSIAGLREEPGQDDMTVSGPLNRVDQPDIEPSNPVRLEPEPDPVSVPQVFLPSGSWELDEYQLNGTDLSEFNDADIQFQTLSDSQVSWSSEFFTSDIYGNISEFYYSGTIRSQGQTYYLRVTGSNDPSMMGQVETPLTMRMEGQRLHMEYQLQGNHILLHWIR